MTTEELFDKYKHGIFLQEDNFVYVVDKEDFEKSMIEFAKYHVTKALKEASIEADITQELGSSGNWFNCVDKDSVLNAYPLDLIK